MGYHMERSTESLVLALDALNTLKLLTSPLLTYQFDDGSSDSPCTPPRH